ncbi:MAG: hypothetical protein MI757_20470, partial [Pirellulales bacterium]|nr:hypothetical protein [Pirellulales bacterium]
MHQVATTPSRIPNEIARKLGGLRSAAHRWLLIHSLGRFLVMVVVICLVDALIDWQFRMDWAQRLLVAIGVAGALAYYFVRHVIVPLTTTITDEALCQRVEKTNPELAQRLISAVEFSRMGDLEALGLSPAMVDATIEEGTEMASKINFKYSLRRDAFLQNVILLAIGIAGVAAIATAVVIGARQAQESGSVTGRDADSHTLPRMADIWFNRNVLLGDKQWPQNTYLEVLGVDEQGRLVFPRGDDKLLTVLVTEDSIVNPDIVYLEKKSEGGWKKIQMNVEGDEHTEFSHLFKNVLKPFEFRVYDSGSDHVSPWYKVVLQPRPEVDSLDLVLTPPEYTGQGALPLSREHSPYDVLPGSGLKVSGTTSQPVREAWLLGARQVSDESGIAMNVEGGTRIEAFVDPQRLKPGEYRIRLINNDGLESKVHPLFNIRNLPDEDPNVAARLRGISSLITNRAV